MRVLWLSIAMLSLASSPLAQGNTDKDATVTVVNGKISTSPEPIPVKKNQNRIVWTLEGAGYTFAGNGIVIQGGGNEYGNCERKTSGKKEQFICKKLKHVDLKKYKYDVNLIDPSGKVVNFDPYIVNE